MCFRPAQVEMNTCPKCGATNKPIAKECAQCGEPLQIKHVGIDADAGLIDAASTYKAPGAPAAPKAPGAPAPAAPKAPLSGPKA